MNIISTVFPWYIRWMLIAILCTSFSVTAWLKGNEAKQKEWDDAKIAAAMHRTQQIATQNLITANSAAWAAQSERVIRKLAAQVANNLEIKYVTPSDDAKCVVPIGVVRMRNDTAGTYMPIPHGARKPDETTGSITADPN